MLALLLVADLLGALVGACLDVLAMPLFAWIGWASLTVFTFGLYRPDLDEHDDRLLSACAGVATLVVTFGTILAV